VSKVRADQLLVAQVGREPDAGAGVDFGRQCVRGRQTRRQAGDLLAEDAALTVKGRDPWVRAAGSG
jgi:hypothetical protein